jgi:hypothetical protein
LTPSFWLCVEFQINPHLPTQLRQQPDFASVARVLLDGLDLMPFTISFLAFCRNLLNGEHGNPMMHMSASLNFGSLHTAL